MLLSSNLNAQDISLYQQFNGRFDYTAIGNTLNLTENGLNGTCDIYTSSSALLNLNSSQTITAAYLYWAGSGAGDFNVNLNGIEIMAERTFNINLDASRQFFAAFADVTELVINEGVGNYTLSELDLTSVIPPYCPSGTNFGGWAITIIYEDLNLPLNQLNVYDGLQSVPEQLEVTLDNLNVLDNEGAKIGFVAWEGDSALAVNEQLTINGNAIGNPPLNPVNNAFNGTNSFTGETNLYNMDIDVYDIQNNIDIGDTSAIIQLTSGQDFVMINNIITVLNSQLPDATVTIDSDIINCGDRSIDVEYTIYNTNSTEILPSNVPIAFYADGTLIGTSQTASALDINEQDSYVTTLEIPIGIPENFQLSIVVDDNGSGIGMVTEINETNNWDNAQLVLLEIPEIIALGISTACDEGFNSAVFNLPLLFEEETNLDISNLSFYASITDLEQGINPISIPEQFTNDQNPQTIYIKFPLDTCYQPYSLTVQVENCPPYIPQGFSPNGDGKNDWFNIQGLYDIFEHHELLIYNRYGDLIFKGNNNLKWDGLVNRGMNRNGKLVPVGTYFYVLHLNDPNFNSLTGWVYLNR
ncbi:MAG: hypothetical protein BM564_05305 [Bacteroidetes bacterium MedPE-SWsnd-G2]|nr:MAG: hypothetical protein BM564_05305 [Bacteroidetes bacterium MedPE-SWsnd-G2]